MKLSHCALLLAAIASAACTGTKNNASASDTVAQTAPALQSRYMADPDSLLGFVAAQTAIGPRVPGSEAHGKCVDFITSSLEKHGVTSVSIQEAPVTTADGTRLTARNIFASINPDATERVLLLAHYDTRPWADNDPDPAMHNTPIDGANDGASGVAVLLETARLLGPVPPDSIGVDLLFVDVEDSGRSDGPDSDATWCLGSREWVKQMPYTPADKPRYAILLDMVGGIGAKFHREHFSHRSAPGVVDRVWAVARQSGYGDRFINTTGGAVIDDHININNAGIPCIDIIESLNDATGTFNPTWHTMADNIKAIDPASLKAVTQTVLNTIITP